MPSVPCTRIVRLAVLLLAAVPAAPAHAEGTVYALLAPGRTVDIVRSRAYGADHAQYDIVSEASEQYVRLVVKSVALDGKTLGTSGCKLVEYDGPLLIEDDGVSTPVLFSLREGVERGADPVVVFASIASGIWQLFDPCYWLNLSADDNCQWNCRFVNGCLTMELECTHESPGFPGLISCSCEYTTCDGGPVESYCSCIEYSYDLLHYVPCELVGFSCP